MSHPDPRYDPNDFKFHLTSKAIRTGDIFSANERSKNGFYYSYNFTLKELAEGVEVTKDGHLIY